MSCVLGGVTFDRDPIWTDRNRYNDISAESSIAIDGSEIVVNAEIGAQYPITLESTTETGWLSGTTITSLRALSAVVSAYYTLVLNGTSYTVRFRNEIDGGAIQVQTLFNLTNPGATDVWYGTVYLMAVA